MAVGMVVAALLAASSGPASPVLLNAIWVIGLGVVCGVVLGLAAGLLVGTFAGVLRHRFDALWPVAAASTFLLTCVIGSILVFNNAEEPARSHHVLVGLAWTFAIATVLAVVAGIASSGVRGISSSG